MDRKPNKIIIPLHKISEWLLEEYKNQYRAFRLYFQVAAVCLALSFLFILIRGLDMSLLKKIMISKSGLGITLTGVVTFLSSQIRQRDLEETKKRFLMHFGNSKKDVEKEVNQLILNITADKLNPKKEENG